MVRSAGGWARPLVRQGPADGHGADGPQVATCQVLADLQDQVLHGGLGAAGLVRAARAVGPIDAIQALAFGPLDPVRHGGNADAEPPGNGMQGLAATGGGDHGSPPLRLTLCLLMGLPCDGSLLWLL
jgi:hypothetical protein